MEWLQESDITLGQVRCALKTCLFVYCQLQCQVTVGHLIKWIKSGVNSGINTELNT